jgi:hypothetical protein
VTKGDGGFHRVMTTTKEMPDGYRSLRLQSYRQNRRGRSAPAAAEDEGQRRPHPPIEQHGAPRAAGERGAGRHARSGLPPLARTGGLPRWSRAKALLAVLELELGPAPADR